MKTKKLIAVLICALMCLAIPPAQAETAMDTYFLSDIDITISVPTEWYVGTAVEGLDSELAVSFGLDQADIDSLFVNSDMSLFAITDPSANRQLQVIVVNGMSEGDMRSMTAEEEQAFLEDMRHSTVNGGAEVIAYEIFRTPYTAYCKMYSEYFDYSALSYSTYFDGTGYIVQLVDYNNVPFDEATIALADEIVLSILYSESAPDADSAEQGSSAYDASHPGAPEPTAIEGVSVYRFPEFGITLPIYDTWYTAAYTEGVESELAALAEWDEAYAAKTFAEENGCALLMVGFINEGTCVEFEVSNGLEGIDARDDSFDWEAIADDFANPEYYPGQTVYEWGSIRTPHANVIKLCMTANDGSVSQVKYIFLFENACFELRYFDTTGEPISEDAVLAMDYLVLNLSFE